MLNCQASRSITLLKLHETTSSTFAHSSREQSVSSLPVWGSWTVRSSEPVATFFLVVIGAQTDFWASNLYPWLHSNSLLPDFCSKAHHMSIRGSGVLVEPSNTISEANSCKSWCFLMLLCQMNPNQDSRKRGHCLPDLSKASLRVDDLFRSLSSQKHFLGCHGSKSDCRYLPAAATFVSHISNTFKV